MDAAQLGMVDALVAEQRKAQTNSAKLRAVAQRVEYDEFEKIVAGAHLKPVKPVSRESAAISKDFDFFVMPKYHAAVPTLPPPPAAALGAPANAAAPPSSAHDFMRAWRRLCKSPAERASYVRAIEPASLERMFRTEMDALLFDEIVEALAHAASTASAAPSCAWAVDWLEGLTRVSRFGTTLLLADGARISALFSSLSRLGCSFPPGLARLYGLGDEV